MRFFFWIYTLDNSGLFLHVAGGLCSSQISVKHTSLCDYLECGAATFLISCSLISKNRLCAWIWEFVCLWWNESACCWFRSELDPLSDEHLVYIIQHTGVCHPRMYACIHAYTRVYISEFVHEHFYVSGRLVTMALRVKQSNAYSDLSCLLFHNPAAIYRILHILPLCLLPLAFSL